MNEVLLSAGAAAVILAVVGGGAKAFGVEVPVLSSRARQVMLALVGVAFLATAVVLRDGDGDDRPSEEVQAYRQDVLAACRSLQADAGLPPIGADGTIGRSDLLAFVRTQIDSSESVLSELWNRPIPSGLEDEAADARRDARRLVRQTRTATTQVGASLPASVDVQQVFSTLQQIGSRTRPSAARFEGSMSRLAGRPCRPSVADSDGDGS
jgi:hypothetical protein